MGKKSRLQRIAVYYEKVADSLSILMALMIITVIGAQVFTRTLLDMPLKFSEEVAVFALIALVYTGIGAVERHDEYLRVEVFQNLMPRKVRLCLQLLSKILLLILVFGILQGEYEIFPSISLLKSTAAKIPYSWLHAWIMLFTAIWGFWIIVDSAQLLSQLLKKENELVLLDRNEVRE